jgi:hypothetical protein
MHGYVHIAGVISLILNKEWTLRRVTKWPISKLQRVTSTHKHKFANGVTHCESLFNNSFLIQFQSRRPSWVCGMLVTNWPVGAGVYLYLNYFAQYNLNIALSISNHIIIYLYEFHWKLILFITKLYIDILGVTYTQFKKWKHNREVVSITVLMFHLAMFLKYVLQLLYEICENIAALFLFSLWNFYASTFNALLFYPNILFSTQFPNSLN